MEKTPSLFSMIIKLVIVITIALYIFFTFTFDIFDIHFEKRDLKYSILFEHATGVQVNTQLEMSGFKIGHVTSIKHIKSDGKTKAKVEVVFNKKYKSIITDKSHFFIARRKFIGLTFIQMIPVLEGKHLESGAVINGISPPRYSLLFDRAKQLLVFFNKFLRESHFNELLAEYNNMTKESKDLKAQVDKRLVSIKKNSNKLISNLKKLKKVYEKEEEYLIENTKEIFLVGDRLLNNNKKRINSTLDKSSDLSDKVIDLKDDTLFMLKKEKKDIQKIIDNVKSSVKKVEDLQTGSNKVIEVLDLGVGNIGLFLNDKEIYDYSRFIMKIIKQESYRYFLPIKHKVRK